MARAKNHLNNCYFCTIYVSGDNYKNRKIIVYPILTSTYRPTGYRLELPVSMPRESMAEV